MTTLLQQDKNNQQFTYSDNNIDERSNVMDLYEDNDEPPFALSTCTMMSNNNDDTGIHPTSSLTMMKPYYKTNTLTDHSNNNAMYSSRASDTGVTIPCQNTITTTTSTIASSSNYSPNNSSSFHYSTTSMIPPSSTSLLSDPNPMKHTNGYNTSTISTVSTLELQHHFQSQHSSSVAALSYPTMNNSHSHTNNNSNGMTTTSTTTTTVSSDHTNHSMHHNYKSNNQNSNPCSSSSYQCYSHGSSNSNNKQMDADNNVKNLDTITTSSSHYFHHSDDRDLIIENHNNKYDNMSSNSISSSSSHMMLSNNSMGFTQLMQQADDTHHDENDNDNNNSKMTSNFSDHSAIRTIQKQPNPMAQKYLLTSVEEFMEEENHYNSSNNICDNNTNCANTTKTNENLGTTITPPVNTLQKIEAQILSDDSFSITTRISGCTVREVMDIVANPDLLRIWCEPLSKVFVTDSKGVQPRTQTTQQQLDREENLILPGVIDDSKVNATIDRQYDGEWIHGTSTSLNLPSSHTNILYKFLSASKAYFGFPSCGNVTMFIERNRGQISLTIGPFQDNVSSLIFGGDSVILINTIKAVQLNDNNSTCTTGDVELVSTVQLMSSSSSDYYHPTNKYSANTTDSDGAMFVGEILHMAKEITDSSLICNPLSYFPCTSSCYDEQEYNLDGFIRQTLNSIQKLSILIEEGETAATANYYGNSRELYPLIEDNDEEAFGFVPLLP